METSYRFWYIKRDDDGVITEVAVRFYEGAVIPYTRKVVNPETLEMTEETVVGYVPLKRLEKKEIKHIKKEFKKELNGNDCAVYTQEDFGVTTDQDDIVVFLNKELKKDKNRVPQDGQKFTTKAALLNREK